MNEIPDPTDKDTPLTGVRALTRMAAIGAVLLVAAGAFAYTAGWLSPHRLTQAKMMAAFESDAGDHPETVRAVVLIKNRRLSSGFADSTFNSLDAFRLVNAAGVSVPVRWATIPLQEFTPDRGAKDAHHDRNYLFDDLIAGIHRQPLQWRLVFTLGRPGDPTDDATLPWPDDRRHFDAGLVSIDRVFSEDWGPCNDINYDPLVLPCGIEPSDDPLLSARSASYARSFTLRTSEKRKKLPAAVTIQEARAGETP